MNKLISLREINEELLIEYNKIKEYIREQKIEVYNIEEEEFILEVHLIDLFLTLKNEINQTEQVVNEEIKKGLYSERNKLNDLTGSEWLPETKSFWYQKGLGKSHPHAQIERQHPAPFSFQDIARLINFFTKSGEVVLDPFLGVGSTLKAAALNNRIGIGIELSPKWSDLAKQRLEIEVEEGESKKHKIITGDSRILLKQIERNSVDFIVTSPPYWAILNKKADHKVKNRVQNNLATNYSDFENDLGNISSYSKFLDILTHEIFEESGKVLKPEKYLAIVVSDFRHKSRFISFHSDLIQRLDNLQVGDKHILKLQGVKVLLQNHKSLLPYGYPFSYVENIHHQYILIFRKTVVKKNV